MLVLLYASNAGLPLGDWQAWGKIHVYLLHFITELAESWSTATLYFHGLTHTFGQPYLPIKCSEEAGERDLRLGNTFSTLTTTCPEDSIREQAHMSCILTPRPEKGGGRKYSCGSLSSGHECWNNVFSVRRQSGVSLWSAFYGHYWYYQP